MENKSKLPVYIILALCGALILMAFWNISLRGSVNTTEDQNKREKAALKASRDSLKIAKQELREERLLAIAVMQKEKLEADQKVAAAEKKVKQYERIIYVRTVSDHQRDSILSAILQN